MYFNKYLKYKKKYLELKQIIGSSKKEKKQLNTKIRLMLNPKNIKLELFTKENIKQIKKHVNFIYFLIILLDNNEKAKLEKICDFIKPYDIDQVLKYFSYGKKGTVHDPPFVITTVDRMIDEAGVMAIRLQLDLLLTTYSNKIQKYLITSNINNLIIHYLFNRILIFYETGNISKVSNAIYFNLYERKMYDLLIHILNIYITKGNNIFDITDHRNLSILFHLLKQELYGCIDALEFFQILFQN